MNKITKEMCKVFIKDYYRSINIFLCFVFIFALVALWFFTKKILIVAIATVIFLLLSIALILITNHKIANIDFSEFYLAEDVVVAFKKRRYGTKNSAGHNYIYTFKDHGKHTISKSSYPTIEIPLHKEKNISHLSVEKLSIQSCNKGDLFYLLVHNGSKRIIKCFPKYNFDVVQADFDFVDGKYYCPKQ